MMGVPELALRIDHQHRRPDYEHGGYRLYDLVTLG